MAARPATIVSTSRSRNASSIGRHVTQHAHDDGTDHEIADVVEIEVGPQLTSQLRQLEHGPEWLQLLGGHLRVQARVLRVALGRVENRREDARLAVVERLLGDCDEAARGGRPADRPNSASASARA